MPDVLDIDCAPSASNALKSVNVCSGYLFQTDIDGWNYGLL